MSPASFAAAGRWRGLLAWSPSPAIRASFALHAGGLLAMAAEPGLWPEALSVLTANHLALSSCMHPRCGLLGPVLTRLPGTEPRVALTFDDGPDPEVTPRVLDLLDTWGAKASFFVIGERAARNPALLREMLQRGHGIENHTHRHPLGFAAWTPGAMLREIVTAQAAIADACGQAPRYFRPPAGLRSPLLDPVLSVAGLSLVAWTRRGYDAVSPHPARVLARLGRGLGPGDVLLLHDGRSARGYPGRSIALEVLPALLARIAEAGLSAVVLPPAEKRCMPPPQQGWEARKHLQRHWQVDGRWSEQAGRGSLKGRRQTVPPILDTAFRRRSSAMRSGSIMCSA